MTSILERYPILARLPEEARAGYAAKSDLGLALTGDECAALGLARCESLVLIPVCGDTPDLLTVFGGDVGALREIMKAGTERKSA